MTRAIRSLALAALLAGFGCASPKPPTAPSALGPAATAPPVRVLMLTATAGFRHDSIATARQVMSGLATSSGEFTVTATEDLATISSTNLAAFDVVFFANTSGELPFSATQKAALLDFVTAGKGFIGTHSATDTWEEFYTFRDNPRPRVQVLLRLDAASVGSTGDYPLAWAQSFGSGRTYYNALGHFDSTWTDRRFQQQLVGAIRWAAKRS